jgi:hypothetical protein
MNRLPVILSVCCIVLAGVAAPVAVRNPFWPMGYQGEMTPISAEVRPKPKPKPKPVAPKADEKKKIELNRQAATEKAAKETAAKAKAAAELAAKEAAAKAKAAAELAAKEAAAKAKAAAELAAKEAAAKAEAAKPKVITSDDWRKAQRSLKFGNPALFKSDDGTVRASININGNIYVDGDLVSFTHEDVRFTWRIRGLDGKERKLKLERIRARHIEKPKNTGIEQPKKTGGGK